VGTTTVERTFQDFILDMPKNFKIHTPENFQIEEIERRQQSLAEKLSVSKT